MKNLTFEKALELSIKKWEYIVEHNGYEDDYDEFDYHTFCLWEDLPELDLLNSNCGLCEYYRENDGVRIDFCHECPLNDKNIDVSYSDTLFICCCEFDKWGSANKNTIKKWTERMLNKLYELQLSYDNL